MTRDPALQRFVNAALAAALARVPGREAAASLDRVAADLATGRGSDDLTRCMGQPRPKRLPPRPFAWLGATAVIRWQEMRAGREG